MPFYLPVIGALVEAINVTSEYPQDDGWGALLLRLPHWRVTKELWGAW